MASLNRREMLRNLLAGLVQASGAAVVVLASASAQAGVPAGTGDEKPLPEVDPNQQQNQDLEQRVEQAAAQLEEITPTSNGDEDSWVNAGFRNAGFANGGFVNGGFRNAAVGGGFRNTAVGGGGGAFRNTAVGGVGGGFRNGAFRNW
jgi:hypothetical protein